MKNCAYKKNTLGKYASDFMTKKDLQKKVKRTNRQRDRKVCKEWVKG